jgi:hydrogenase nickel incorporation protein HypB
MHATNGEADANRGLLDSMGVVGFNLMSSPGTGNTTLLEATLEKLIQQYRIAVLEGDMTTELDAERLRAYGIPVTAITTGRACHLDAHQVGHGLDDLNLSELDTVFVENVGNLICPAEFPLGTHYNVVLVSVTEGEDKPLKYPVMFYEADCVIITKIDLCPYLKVDTEKLMQNVHQIRPGIPVFTLSATTGENMDNWLNWLRTSIPAPTALEEAS